MTSDAAFDILLNLWDHLFDPNKRLFWGYLCSTLILASFVWIRQTKQRSLSSFGNYLFNKKIWLHRSAKQDYAIWLLNLLLKVVVFLPLLFSAAPIAIELSFALERLFGEIPPVTLNKLHVSIYFTALLFVLDDASRFLLHLALHKIPMLWRFHKVHHSAQVMTPLTVYRIHPVESLLYAMRLVFVQGIALGIGFYLFGHRLQIIDVLGANIGVFVFNLFAANLRHSHLWLTWPHWLEQWFISPAQHQIHHSDAKIHRDKNLGSALAIWDRMYGSLIRSKEVTHKIRFGVFQPFTSLWQSYLEPLGLMPKNRDKQR